MSLDKNKEVISESDELMHYGVKRRSGRYPWGSGDEPYQHSGDFVSRVKKLRSEGLTDKQISDHFKLTLDDFRSEYRLANDERKYLEFQKVKDLKEKGFSNYKIAEKLGYKNESTVRSMLNNEHTEAKLLEAKETADFLKDQIKNKRIIDVGKGVERELGISREKLDEAIYALRMEGYTRYNRYIDQNTNQGQKTTYDILCDKDTEFSDIRDVVGDIKSITDYKSSDDGKSFQPKFVYPNSLDSKRLAIRYTEDGGSDKDGIIELRRGVDDLSLGESRYAQVRILVDGKKYIKGVAVYADDKDMPEGVDVMFNTNKSKSVAKLEVLKDIKENNENPFGTNIKPIDEGGQFYYTDKNGKKQLSLINKKSEEGDWEDWSNNLPSQFLSKQPIPLAKKQLGLAIDRHNQEFEEIKSLTNPTVKKKFLKEFADECDSAAVHLKAAALPSQQHHVLIPINSLKDNEIYAPNYDNGTQVALVRYPHGGTFEIPILTVNNKNAIGRKILGNDVPDAVGINSKVAARLSGADFDGDTAMVIPNPAKYNIKSTPPLKDLEGFDPKMSYGTTEKNGKRYNHNGSEIKIMKDTQKQMGQITNLIADMTLKGAPDTDIAKAVKHSMVVIDAAKHKLDWKQSELDNDIKTLKHTWQGEVNKETGKTSTASSTLITRAKSETQVIKTQGTYRINIKGKDYYDPTKPEGSKLYKVSAKAYYPEPARDDNNPNLIGYRTSTGKKILYDPNNETDYKYYKPVKNNRPDGSVYYTNSDGTITYKTGVRKKQSTKMAETDDAHTLVSNKKLPMELLYADYANKMKALANEARKEDYLTNGTTYSPQSNKIYSSEVNSLKSKLNEAAKNAPRERKANILATVDVEAKLQDNPDLTKEDVKKIKQQATERARDTVGAKRLKINITDKEWEAIQAGAISKTLLEDILNYADMDIIRGKAMPRNNKVLSSAQTNSILSQYKTGRYTRKELADHFNVSVSTIAAILEGKE